MRFTRFFREAHTPNSPQRLACAERKVAADKREASTFLFPEMATVKFQTGGEYIAAVDAQRVQWLKDWRGQRAESWKRARARLRDLSPITKEGILRYWNRSILPGDPVFLLSLIHDVVNKHQSGWTMCRKIRQLELIRLGKLSKPTDWKSF